MFLRWKIAAIFIIASLAFFKVEGNTGVEYIIYSNASHILYVPVEGGESTGILSTEGATLGYDEINYRLWYHESVSLSLYQTGLDGSDSKTVSVPSTFNSFAVDAVNKTIYYVNYVNSGDVSVQSIDYDGVALPEIADLQSHNDYEDIEIDAYNRSIFLTTDQSNSRNLIRYNLADGTEETLHDSISGIGTHLTVDTENKLVYWILFTEENNYNIFKTTYSGATSQIGADQTGSVSDVDIAQGDGYFYILNSASSKIKKYNKTTETMVSAISISPGAQRIIVVTVEPTTPTSTPVATTEPAEPILPIPTTVTTIELVPATTPKSTAATTTKQVLATTPISTVVTTTKQANTDSAQSSHCPSAIAFIVLIAVVIV